MRNPLHQQAARRRAIVNQSGHAPDSLGRKAIELRAPHVNIRAGGAQARGDLRAVIADASELRRVLTGNQMPVRQTYSSETWP
jgi:hypothetical protein